TVLLAIENALHGGLVITDNSLPDNPVVYCNPGYEKISGYNKEEVLGRNCRFLQGEHTDPAKIELIRDAISEKQDCSVVMRNYRKDGSEFWNGLSVSPVLNTNGETTHFLGLVDDVSERIDAEEALRTSELKLQQTQRLAKIGYLEWDVETMMPLQCSDSLPGLIGISRESILTQPGALYKAVHPDDRNWFAEIDRQMAQGGHEYELEFRIVRPGGEIRHIREIGELAYRKNRAQRCCLSTMQDITEQKQALEQLSESQRRLETLIGNLPGMAYRCRYDERYTMEFVTDGSYLLTGYYPADLIQNHRINFFDLVLPDFKEESRTKLHSSVDKDIPFTLEYQIKTGSGETKWVWEHGVGVRSDTGEVLTLEGYIVDITDRKQAELERQSSVDRFRDFSRIAADWFWEMGPDLRFTYASGQFYRTMGITAADVIGRTRGEVHDGPTYHRNKWTEHIKTLEAGEPFQDFEVLWTRPDGTTRNLCLSGEPLYNKDGSFAGYRGVGRDITAQKRIESQLRAHIELSPDAIVIIDRNGAIRFANAIASQLLGYTHEELIRSNTEKMAPAGTRVRHIELREAYFDSPRTRTLGDDFDLMAVRKDGTEFPLEVSVSPIEDAGETLVLASLRDVSERKSHEAEMRQQLLAYAHDDRLSTAGELASGLAHELNQPLTAISNNCDTGLIIARESPGMDPDLVQILEENYEFSHRAGQIIHSLRQLTQKGQHDKSPTDINSIITETVKLVATEARFAQVEIKLNLQKQLPIILIDAVQIQQVMVNLERNAIESMSRSDVSERVLSIRSTQLDPDTIKITVEDNGPGIRADIADEIFNAYTTSRKEGMGLGLSISRSMISLHGGQLWFERDRESGAVFHFTLAVS
nr:PAS domain S-box protein [Granulosicoccus sp.]